MKTEWFLYIPLIFLPTFHWKQQQQQKKLFNAVSRIRVYVQDKVYRMHFDEHKIRDYREGVVKDRIADKELGLHVTDLGMISGIPYGLWALPGVISECKAMSKAWVLLDIIPQVNSIRSFWKATQINIPLLFAFVFLFPSLNCGNHHSHSGSGYTTTH